MIHEDSWNATDGSSPGKMGPVWTLTVTWELVWYHSNDRPKRTHSQHLWGEVARKRKAFKYAQNALFFVMAASSESSHALFREQGRGEAASSKDFLTWRRRKMTKKKVATVADSGLTRSTSTVLVKAEYHKHFGLCVWYGWLVSVVQKRARTQTRAKVETQNCALNLLLRVSSGDVAAPFATSEENNDWTVNSSIKVSATDRQEWLVRRHFMPYCAWREAIFAGKSGLCTCRMVRVRGVRATWTARGCFIVGLRRSKTSSKPKRRHLDDLRGRPLSFMDVTETRTGGARVPDVIGERTQRLFQDFLEGYAESSWWSRPWYWFLIETPDSVCLFKDSRMKPGDMLKKCRSCSVLNETRWPSVSQMSRPRAIL